MEGAVEAHLYAIVEGRVRVHRGERTVVELGAGATVGELAVLVPAPRAASVTTIEPTHVLRVDQAVLDELFVDWPELAQGVIAELVSRLRATTDIASTSSRRPASPNFALACTVGNRCRRAALRCPPGPRRCSRTSPERHLRRNRIPRTGASSGRQRTRF